jgi:Uncharacterized protein conserved in bacteria (DUF2252)
LLPVRYFRMQADPFAFFRGAAAIMAADLATMPSTGIRLQACGDAHFANFGSYATPEGTAIFDLNDFDETLPAQFEWDVKRLPFLDTYRTMCLAPKPEFRRLLEGIRDMRLTKPSQCGHAASLSG